MFVAVALPLPGKEIYTRHLLIKYVDACEDGRVGGSMDGWMDACIGRWMVIERQNHIVTWKVLGDGPLGKKHQRSQRELQKQR